MVDQTSNIKNTLRPFFNYKGQRHMRQKSRNLPWKEFQNLRLFTNQSNYNKLFEIVEEKKHYPFPGLGNTFPMDRKYIPDVRLKDLSALLPEREVALQIARVKHHKDRLIKAVQSIDEINTALLSNDLGVAEVLVSQHLKVYGYSVVLAKKMLLLALEQGGPLRVRQVQRDLTDGYEYSGWAVLINYIYDNVDPAFEIGSANRVWQSLRKSWGDRGNWVTSFAVSDSILCARSSSFAAESILRAGSISLLDCLITLWKLNYTEEQPEQIRRQLEVIFREEFESSAQLLSVKRVCIPAHYAKKRSACSDSDFYRTSFFYDEYTNIGVWRYEINKLMSPDVDLVGKDILPVNEFIDDSIDLLISDPDNEDDAFQQIMYWTSQLVEKGVRINSSSFILSLFVGRAILENKGTIEPFSLVKLLAKSPNAVHYLNIGSVKQLLDTQQVKDHSLASFVLWDVLYRKSRNPDFELERRAAFMSLFIGKNYLEIVPYIDSVRSWSAQTAIMLSAACTRSFLEKLYLLMSSVKDVIESRLAICLWSEKHGFATGSMIEERKALERELANLDARSDLDSTRIHVDEEYLREWFNETQKPLVNRYIQTALTEGSERLNESVLNFYLKQRELGSDGVAEVLNDTQIGSDFILVRIFDETLKTFASDKSFGLDSYLSRRIRHGTLSGNIITPINRIIRKTNDQVIASSSPADDKETLISKLAIWEANLIANIDRLRSSIIQIKSNQFSSGLIRATWKIPTNLTHLDAMVARVKLRILDSNGEYDLFSDIHSLCWDCIEPDLANLRFHMTRVFLPDVLFSLRDIYEGLPSESQRLAFPALAQIETTLQARVQEICGWFIRPVFRRDEYELRTLINSTFSIIKDLDVDYDFNEKLSCQNDIVLNRGGFEVIGDTLFVLIGNAARHGRKGADIMVEVCQITGTENVQISVRSFVVDEKKFMHSLVRIKEAMSDNFVNTANAAVQEGFSGIKKLRSILYRLRSREYSIRVTTDLADLSFSFVAILPAFVAFRRERT